MFGSSPAIFDVLPAKPGTSVPWGLTFPANRNDAIMEPRFGWDDKASATKPGGVTVHE
jgi:hypothetical protein